MQTLKSLYERDFNLWTEAQTRALKEKRFDDLDIPGLIEEISDLAKRDKKALRSHLRILLLHLLKWQYQPDKRSTSWSVSITNARIEIEDLLMDSPSLKPYLPSVAVKTYQQARLLAAKETGLPLHQFPAQCPYDINQVLDSGFQPG